MMSAEEIQEAAQRIRRDQELLRGLATSSDTSWTMSPSPRDATVESPLPYPQKDTAKLVMLGILTGITIVLFGRLVI